MYNCKKCKEIIASFGCNYEARIEESYTYDEKIGKFKKECFEIVDDRDVYFYCLNCGATIDDSIINKLEI